MARYVSALAAKKATAEPSAPKSAAPMPTPRGVRKSGVYVHAKAMPMARENSTSQRPSLDAAISMELRMNAVGFTLVFPPGFCAGQSSSGVGGGLSLRRGDAFCHSCGIVPCKSCELKNSQLDISTMRLRRVLLPNFNISNDVSGTAVGLLCKPSDGNAPSGVAHHATRTHREGAGGRPTLKRMD